MPDTDEPRFLRRGTPRPQICKAIISTEKRAQGIVPVRCNRAFADGQDVCRCGARRPPISDLDHGYTTRGSSAMRGEGEAVPAQIQEQYSKVASERDAEERAAMRRRALAAIEEIVPHSSGRERKRLRAAANQIRALDRTDEQAA
jgi:hypothetical protein